MSTHVTQQERLQPRQRIAITGMGVYTPLGASPQALLGSILASRSGISVLHQYASLAPHLTIHAGGITGHQPREWFSEETARTLERTAQFAAIAAEQARADAGLRDSRAERTALVMGVCVGGQDGLVECLEDGRVDASEQAWRLLRSSQYAQTEAVASLLGVRGPLVTISTACASSATALGHACVLLRHGKADVVIAGGSDAFSLLVHAGFNAVGAIADGPCSP
ncbi:MAG TPA: beta-ketoacyl synthase N-terminal-like domain-containing protein, partial [Myxococcaceae bacterium]|nr:beta-ketoacyl synthase N-terminal-like domain-containing protein [Myxococcaceae bacterium]